MSAPRLFRCGLLVVLVLSGVLSPTSATGADRPYRATGTAQFINPTEFVGDGNATHLGRYHERGSAFFTPTGDPFVFQIDAWSIYTAANGDELHAIFAGDLNVVTGQIFANATYFGGTGRFTDADGSSILVGQMFPDGSISVIVSGSISY